MPSLPRPITRCYLPAWFAQVATGCSLLVLGACEPGPSRSAPWYGRVILIGQVGGIGSELSLPDGTLKSSVDGTLSVSGMVLRQQTPGCDPTGPCSKKNEYVLEAPGQQPLKFSGEGQTFGEVTEYDGGGCSVAKLSSLRVARSQFVFENGLEGTARVDISELYSFCSITVKIEPRTQTPSDFPSSESILYVNDSPQRFAKGNLSITLPTTLSGMPTKLSLKLKQGWELVDWSFQKSGPDSTYSSCSGLDACTLKGFGGVVTAHVAPTGECELIDQNNICRENSRRGLRGIWGFVHQKDPSNPYEEYWAVGREGTIVHVNNGQELWDRRTDDSRDLLRGIWGASMGEAAAALVVGERGKIMRFDPFAREWQIERSPLDTQPALYAVSGSVNENSPGTSYIFAVGESGTLLERKGPSQWDPISVSGAGNLYAAATDGVKSYAAGAGGNIYVCTPAPPASGCRWALFAKKAVEDEIGSLDVRALWIGADGIWVAAGPDTANQSRLVLFSRNGDKVLNKTVSMTINGLYGLASSNQDVIFAVGNEGYFFKYSRSADSGSAKGIDIKQVSSKAGLWSAWMGIKQPETLLVGGDSGVLRIKKEGPPNPLRADDAAATDGWLSIEQDWPVREPLRQFAH